MPYLLKDIEDGVLIAFSRSESVTNIIAAVFTIISVGADSLAIYALVKQRYIPADSRYLLSIVCADFCFGVIGIFTYTSNGNYFDWLATD